MFMTYDNSPALQRGHGQSCQQAVLRKPVIYTERKVPLPYATDRIELKWIKKISIKEQRLYSSWKDTGNSCDSGLNNDLLDRKLKLTTKGKITWTPSVSQTFVCY